MSTKFLSPGWRMPRNANQSKSSNYSMDFDGSDHIDLNFQSLTTPATISIWVNTDVNDSQQRYAIINGRADQQPTVYLRMQTDNTYQVFISNTNGSDTLQGSSATINTWFHFAIVCENSQTLLYENGVLKDSSTIGWNGIDIDQSNNWQLGRDNRGQRYWSGKLSQAVFFDYALSASQVTTLWGGGTSVSNPMALPSPPIAYYPLGTSAYNGEYLAENNAIGDYVFDFDVASDDYIQINNGSSLTNGFSELTVSIWANFSTTGTNQQQIITKDGATSQRSWNLRKLSSGVNFLVSTDGTSASQTLFYPNANITVGKWYHFVGIYDGSKLLLYVNGVLIDDSVSLTGSLPSTTSGLFIGSYGYNNSTTFDGKLSNAQIWDTSLSATEVETLYNYGSPIKTLANIPQSSNLQGWWKLDASDTYDSSTGNWTITDHSSNSNNGTSSGMSQASLVQSDLQTVAPYSKYAMDFDASSGDYIDASTLSVIGDWSVSLWVKTNSTSYQTAIQLSNSTTTGNNDSTIFLYWYPGGALAKWGFYSGQGSSSLFGTTALNTNQWYHLVVTKSGATYTLFLNASQENQATLNNINIEDFLIGGRSYNNFYMDGSISNASIWNTALTSSQVTEIYNEGLPSNLNSHSAYSNLVSWWQLGENSSFDGNDWIVADEKGTNNGTSVSMPVGALVNGVGTTANGVSSGMSEGNLVGDAPYSTANALSTNMVITSRVLDVAPSPFNMRSILYDGVDSRTETSVNYSEFDGETKGTFSFWFKCNGNTSNNNDKVLKIGPPYGRRTIEIALTMGDQVRFYYRIAQSGSGRQTYADIGNFRQDGLWHHVLFCVDLSLSTSSDKTKLFVDGSPITLTGVINNSSFPSHPATLTVGGTTEANKSFMGSLDEVALWSGVDLRNNISTIYNLGNPNDLNGNGLTAPTSWYRMGDGDTYPTLNDNGTSGYNLTMVNASSSDIVEDVPS